jgi:hypothetical protein
MRGNPSDLVSSLNARIVELHFSREGMQHQAEIKDGISMVATNCLYKVDSFMHVRLYVAASSNADETLLQYARGQTRWFETVSVRAPTLEDVFLKVAGVSFDRAGTMTYKSVTAMFDRYLGRN